MLLDTRSLQPASALAKRERTNFADEKAPMQWWYFDVLLGDGGVLMVAFVPRKWWPDAAGARTDEALLFVALRRGASREVLSASRTLDAASLRASDRSLEIPGGLTIARDAEDLATYRLAFELEEIRGSLEVRSLVRPFSAFPLGQVPGWARSTFMGGGSKAKAFSYVSQVPRGAARGELVLGSERIVVQGHAYHEQGRFEDAPERLGRGWLWCHFLHAEWNLFGSPGVFLFVQRQQQRPLFSGINLFDRSLGLKNRAMVGEPPHPKVFSGGELRFARDGLKLTIVADPKRISPLVSFPSATTPQIWHTLVADAELAVDRGGALDRYPGQMILETCWLGR